MWCTYIRSISNRSLISVLIKIRDSSVPKNVSFGIYAPALQDCWLEPMLVKCCIELVIHIGLVVYTKLLLLLL